MSHYTFSNPEVAGEILSLLLEISQKINDSATSVEQTCPNEEFVAYRRAAARILGGEVFDVVRSICDQYPVLKPAGLFDRG